MPDNGLGSRWRRRAQIVKGERTATAQALTLLKAVLAYSATTLSKNSYDPGILSWDAAQMETPNRGRPLAALLGTIEGQFLLAWGRTERGVIDPDPYALRYLEATTNRLAGVPDEVFDAMRVTLAEGRAAQEGIPELAARVESLLRDEDRWAGRAQLIARTEVLTANRAGSHGSAGATAEYLGVDPSMVVKTWLATTDDRTRPAHLEMDGVQVLGLDGVFQPEGEPGQVFPSEPNCRCDVLYSYPGDRDYPASTPMTLAAAASTQEETRMDHLTAAIGDGHEDDTTVWVALLPSADDPVQGIGEEDPKHATLLFLGEASTLPEGAEEAVKAACAAVAADTDPFASDVSGVDSLGDEGARVWMLTGDTVPDVRDDILDDDLGISGYLDNAEQYPTFQPHVTIGYPDEDLTPDGVEPELTLDDETEQAAAEVTSITFDRIALWWAGQETTWTLADNAEEPVTETPEAVAAAAGDPAPVPVDADPIEPGIQLPGDDLGDQFYGVCTVEDSQTGDGRVFAPGAITWDVPFPIPAGWQVQDAPGHDGSVIYGRVDTLMRFGNLIAYIGTYDLDGAGWEVRRLVEGRFLTGVSVDTDDFDALVVDQDGNPVDPFLGMMGEEQDAVLLVQGARVRSFSACRVPAFVEAFIANGTPPEGWAGERPGTAPVEGVEAPVEPVEPVEVLPEPEEVTAALVAAAGRAGNPPAALPPAEHFADPGLTTPTPITIGDDGRVYGHIACWGVCHVGLDGCVTPPSSRSAYAYFLTGEVETTAGYMPVGQITMGTGHASTSMGARPAAAHYDDTGFAVADVFCGEDEHGIWVAGRLRDGIEPSQVSVLRAAGALSGDWRKIGGNLELVAALAVNVPGFPVPRFSIAASAGEPVALVAAGMVPSSERVKDREVVEAGSKMLLTMSEVYAAIDRRDRRRAAASRLDSRRAEARRARLATARGRINERA